MTGLNQRSRDRRTAPLETKERESDRVCLPREGSLLGKARAACVMRHTHARVPFCARGCAYPGKAAIRKPSATSLACVSWPSRWLLFTGSQAAHRLGRAHLHHKVGSLPWLRLRPTAAAWSRLSAAVYTRTNVHLGTRARYGCRVCTPSHRPNNHARARTRYGCHCAPRRKR